MIPLHGQGPDRDHRCRAGCGNVCPSVLGDPSFGHLSRDGDRLILSSHRGDGASGQAVVITTTDVDALFRNPHPAGPARRARAHA
jgi:hypothetical protein